MDRSLFSSTELQLARERRLKFQGTAKIKISQISLPSEYKPDNVERLRRIFDSEDCDRLSLPNHIIATISRDNLMSALSGNQANTNSLISQPSDSYVSLEFPIGQVTCLHGQHRLRAGREYLAPYDRWWTVDLYLNDISRELETELTDEYANEATPTDGEVYRKVRQYQYEASARFEERWLSRLTENKQKRMRQLSQQENSSIRSAFDSLLPIPGLWNAMSIGNLPRVIAVKCDEEIIHYLRYIKDFWSSLVQGDRSQLEKIDYVTVQKLQLLVPGGLDRTKVKGLVLSGEAFPKFNQSERKSIWRGLRRHGEIIPSLHTFFKDLSYLEVAAGCLGRLVDLAALRKPTMRSAMKQIYDPARHDRGHYQIQLSETEFRQCSGTVEEGRESGYRQLWLYAFRHYLQMPKARLKKKKHSKTKFQEANERVVHRMASLALQLGFHSRQIQDLMDDSPDRRLALATLLKARERDHYRYDSIDTLVNQIMACFNEAVPIELRAPRASAPFSTIPRQSRCGKPSLETHEQEQNFLFFDQMESQPSDESVSALFVRRCVYFSFFGRPSEIPPTPIDDDHSTHRRSPPPPASPLFVPDEHNPLEDHQMMGIADHEIDGPDTQHRHSRREERRQRRRQKQERRRQRESRRQQRLSNDGHEGGPAARSHSVTTSHAESSRGSSGNITEVEIDAGNHEPTQPQNTVEELGGNALTADHMPVDPLISESVQPETALREDHHEAEMEDHFVAPEIIINEPSPEHVPDHPEDNARLNGSTEANALPREVDEGEALIQQENGHLVDLPSGHLMTSHYATLGSSRQAAAQTRLGGKDRRLTQIDVKRGHQFTADANVGIEELPPTADLAVQSPLEEVVAEDRAQTLAHLEECPAISESAVADHANPSPTPPLPSMPELIARLRESESPVEVSRESTNRIEDPRPENPHEDLRQERSERPSLEAARPELLTEDRESRRKVPRDKKVAKEARRRQEAKQRAENTPRAAQESENDFTQTRSGDDLFNDDDDSEPAPLEGNPAAVAAGESPSTSSPSQTLKAGRKQFARHARQGPYRRPIEKGQSDRDRPLTQINMQLTASDPPTIPPADPPLPAIPLSEQAPTEDAPNTLPVPQSDHRGVDRRRKAANLIREQRPPIAPSPHVPSKDLIVFRVWTGTRWKEETRVVVDQSDPLRTEREAKRFVEIYHAQLRDARMRTLMPSQCLESARQDGSQSVFLIFPDNETVTDAMEKEAAAFMNSTRNRH